MTPVTPLRSAQADIRRAARFYENEAPGLGADFISEVEHVFMRVSENPEIGTPMRRSARAAIKRFLPPSDSTTASRENASPPQSRMRT